MTPRQILWAAVVVALIVVGVLLFNAGGARVKPALKAATVQAASSGAAAQIEGERARNMARVRQAEKEGIDAIDAAEDLDGVLAEWGAHVDGVRAEGHRAVDPADDR